MSKEYSQQQIAFDFWNEKINARRILSRGHTIRQNGLESFIIGF